MCFFYFYIQIKNRLVGLGQVGWIGVGMRGGGGVSGSHLKRVEEQVAEEADEPQHGAFGDRLVDNEGEEDGVNPQQRNESQSRFCQSAGGGGGGRSFLC